MSRESAGKVIQSYYIITTMYNQYVLVDYLLCDETIPKIGKWNHSGDWLDRFTTYYIYHINDHYKIECILEKNYIPRRLDLTIQRFHEEEWRKVNGVVIGVGTGG